MHFRDAALSQFRLEVSEQELADQRVRPPRASLVATPGHEAQSLGARTAGGGPGGRHPCRDGGGIGLDIFENGRPHEEAAHFGLEISDHLLGQIVVELPFGAGQRVHECPHLARRSTVDGRPYELERRRPTVGPRLKVVQDVGFERVVVGVAEEPSRLALVESEFFPAQFGELTAGPQTLRPTGSGSAGWPRSASEPPERGR